MSRIQNRKGRIKRSLLVAMVASSLMLTALPGGAIPPGSQVSTESSGSGGVDEPGTVLGLVNAEFEFGTTNDYVEINLHWHWTDSEGEQSCTYEGNSEENPELSFDDDGSSILIAIDDSEGPMGLGDCDQTIEYAEAEVLYDDEFLVVERGRNHDNGVHCNTEQRENINNATARVLVTTTEHGVLVDQTGVTDSATYQSSQETCHDTNVPSIPTVGDQLWLLELPQFSLYPPDEFPAGEPFHVSHGWGSDGTPDTSVSATPDYDFELYVDGERAHGAKRLTISDGEWQEVSWIINFNDGLEAGDHIFQVVWTSPHLPTFEQTHTIEFLDE